MCANRALVVVIVWQTITLVLGVSPCTPCAAAPARIWIANSSTGPLTNVSSIADEEVYLLAPVNGQPGEVLNLTIWAQPGSDSGSGLRKLQNISLNIVSESGLVDILDTIQVHNPVFDVNMDPTPDPKRFGSVRDSDEPLDDPLNPTLRPLDTKKPNEVSPSNPDNAIGLQAANPFVPVGQYSGIGPTVLTQDPTWTPIANAYAWRLASFSIQSLGTGNDQISLRIGELGISEAINGELQDSAMTNVIFAPPGQSGPMYNADTDREYDSEPYTAKPGEVADLLIHITNTLAGDYNNDGRVDAADFTVWRDSLGQSGANLPADGDGNGSVGPNDYRLWRSNFGRSLPQQSGAIEVPELSSISFAVVILLAAGGGLSARRKATAIGTLMLVFAGAAPVAFAQVVPIEWIGPDDANWGSKSNWQREDNGGALPSDPIDDFRRFYFTDVIGNRQLSLYSNSASNVGNARVIDQLIFRTPYSTTIKSQPSDTGTLGTGATTLRLSETGGPAREDQNIRIEAEAGSVTLRARVRVTRPNFWRHNSVSDFNVDGPLELNDSLTIDVVDGTNNGASGTGNARLRGAVSGSGGITKLGEGTLTFSNLATHSFTGGLSLEGGVTVVYSQPNNALANIGSGDVAVLNSTIRAGESIAFPAANSFVLNGGGMAFQTNGFDATIAGNISGIGALQKQGPGVLTLQGSNSYSGGTTVSSGILSLDSNAALAPVGAVNLAGSSTALDVNGYTVKIGSLSGVSSSSVTLDGGVLTVGANNLDTTYPGVIGGTNGKLTKTGTGTLTLSGNNSYTGLTTVSSGKLELTGTSDSALYALTGGELQLNNSHRIANSARVSIATTGRFDLNNHSDTIGSLDGFGEVLLGSGTLAVGGNGFSPTYSGVISGTGGFQKIGSETLTLSGNSTYTGTTAISAGILALSGASESNQFSTFGGTLRLNGSNLIKDSAGVAMANGTFDVNGASEAIDSLSGVGTVVLGAGTLSVGANGGTSTFGGNITGGGNLTKVGSGTLTLSGANSYTGKTNISAGTIDLGADNVISNQSEVAVSSGATFNLNGFTDVIGSLTGAGLVDLGESALTVGDTNTDFSFSGNIVGGPSAAFGKRGSGTMTLLGTISLYRCDLGGSVDGGVLALTGTSQASYHVVKRGELRLNAADRITDAARLNIFEPGLFNLQGHNEAIGSLDGAGVVDLGSGALTIGGNGRDSDFTGTIQGSGSLRKVGSSTLTLSGENSYTGGTFVDGGKLVVNGSATGGVTIAAGARLGGSGSIGSVSGPGRVAPGNSAGVLTINGDYTQDADSVLEIEVGGYTYTPAPPLHDRLEVTGTATLAGRLEIPIIDPLKAAGGPSAGHPSINFLTAGSVSGEFGAVILPNPGDLDPSLAVEVTYSVSGASLDFVPKKLNLEFNDTTSDATPTWREIVQSGVSDSSWRDKVTQLPAAEFPRITDDLTIENNSMDSQSVAVVTPMEQVYRATIGSAGSNTMSLVVGDGAGAAETLNAVTEVEVMSNGTLCLNEGLVETVRVNVNGGLVEGVGVIDLAGDAEITPDRQISVMSGVVSPGMNSGSGSTTGELEFNANYTQGAAGELHIDLVSETSSTELDTLTVGGHADLNGMLKVDLSGQTAIAAGEVFTIIYSASGTGEFSEVQIVDSGVLPDGVYLEPFYGAPPEPLAGAAALTSGFLAGLYAGNMGDADFINGVDERDAMAFAAKLLGLDAQQYHFNNEESTYANLTTTFDYTGDGEVDYDDIPGFIDDLAPAQGLSVAGAYAVFGRAMEEVRSSGPGIPEPTAAVLMLIPALGACMPRRSRLG